MTICRTCSKETNYVTETWHCNCPSGHHAPITVAGCFRCHMKRPENVPTNQPNAIDTFTPPGGANGLTLPPDLSFEAWENIGKGLRAFEKNRLWYWGDWLNYGEEHYGERYAQAVEASDYTVGVLYNTTYVAKAFPISRRREISWSHHQAVASLSVEEQDRWLDETEARGLTLSEVRAGVKIAKAALTGGPDPFATLDAAIDKLLALMHSLWPDDPTEAKARVVDRLKEQL